MTEFWNIWSSVLPLAVLIHISIPNPNTVHLACIICQLCSATYHTFNFLTPILYNLGTDGLEQFTAILILLTIICLTLLTRSTLRGEVSTTCEPLILVLAAVGNYPALRLPVAMMGMAIVLSAYVLFKNLHLPERLFPQPPAIFHSHVLWHCAVFAGQLCYVSLQ